MSKSTRFSEHEVRSMVRLAGELGELHGRRPELTDEWVGHLLQGACRLVDAAAASHVFSLGTHPNGEPNLQRTNVWGFDSPMLNLTAEFVRTGEPADVIAHEHNRLMRSQHPLPSGHTYAYALDRLFPRQHWHNSPTYCDFWQKLHLDDCIQAGVMLGGEGAQPTDGFHVRISRPAGHAPFTPRQWKLVQILFDELRWMYAPPANPSPLEKLPSRLRRVAEHLRQGLSEKEVASQLGLSRHTVHDYVKQLYRQFTVSSRAELMAHLLASPASAPARQGQVKSRSSFPR